MTIEDLRVSEFEEEYENSPAQESFLNGENNSGENKESVPISASSINIDVKKSLLTNDDDLNPKNFFGRWLGPIREGSLRGSTLAMASITFGGGCLAFPSAMKSVGWAMALILFFCVAVCSYYTLVILMRAGIKKKTYDYNGLIELSMGSKMVMFSDINNLILCVGVIMSYQKFIYSFASDILEAFFDVDKKNQMIQILIILFCFFFIQIPLTLM